MNHEQGLQAVEIAKLATKVETGEKFLWLIIGASIAAVIGSIWNLVLHYKGKK